MSILAIVTAFTLLPALLTAYAIAVAQATIDTLMFVALGLDLLAFGFDLPWLKLLLSVGCFVMNILSLYELGLSQYLIVTGYASEGSLLMNIALKYAYLTQALFVAAWTVSLWATYISAYDSSTSYSEAVVEAATVLGEQLGDIAGGVAGAVIGGAGSALSTFFSSLVNNPWGLALLGLGAYWLLSDDDKGSSDDAHTTVVVPANPQPNLV